LNKPTKISFHEFADECTILKSKANAEFGKLDVMQLKLQIPSMRI